jgi:RNA polymerase sigma-70 factor (ECF subfamily)
MLAHLAMALLFVFVALLGGSPEAPALVRLALDGNGAALRQLVARLMPVIRARIRRQLHARGRGAVGQHDGDDLAQEVWLTLLGDDGRQLRQYDPERGMTLEGYVGRITEREVHNRLVAARALKRGGDTAEVHLETLPDGEAADGDPEAHAVTRDLAAALDQHLESHLSERGRLVLRYLYTDGEAVETTARALGVTHQVVYNWQHRIRSLADAFLSTTAGAV